MADDLQKEEQLEKDGVPNLPPSPARNAVTSLRKLAANLVPVLIAEVNKRSPLRTASEVTVLKDKQLAPDVVEVIAKSSPSDISDFLTEDGELKNPPELNSESLNEIFDTLIADLIKEEEALLKAKPRGVPLYLGIRRDYEVMPAVSEDGITMQFIVFTLIVVDTKPFPMMSSQEPDDASESDDSTPIAEDDPGDADESEGKPDETPDTAVPFEEQDLSKPALAPDAKIVFEESTEEVAKEKKPQDSTDGEPA